MYIKCDTCDRQIKDYVAYSHFRRKKHARLYNTDEELKICSYCNNAKMKGWVLFRKFNRWINPEVVEWLVAQHPDGMNPNKLTLKELTKPLIYYTKMKMDGKPAKKQVKQMTSLEKKKLTAKLGKQKFNTAVKHEKKADNWLGWDAYDFKEEDLSTLL